MLVVDALVSWLIFILAEGGRKKLTSLVLGDDPERALRPAATAAVQLTAAELCPGDAKRAEELAIMVDPLFKTPVPGAPLGEQATVLEALQVGIAGQLTLLNAPGLTATVRSLTGMPDVSATVVAQMLTGHLVREIVVRGTRGGPLAPLANQLNHDRTHLQGERIEDMLAQLLDWLRDALAPPGGAAGPAGQPLAEVDDPFALEVHRPVEPNVPQPGLPVLPAYVPREHDAALAEVAAAAAAGTSGIAVLVGESSTGKTRACWQALELLRGLEPGWRLWHPIDPMGVIAGLPGVGPRTAVWLNEAQRYLDAADGQGELVAARFRELLRERDQRPVLVLATLWPQFWDELTVPPSGGADPHAQARELLTGHEISVPLKFEDDQLLELQGAGDPRLAQAAAGSRDGQVIQYLAGAPELLARYQHARPAARALIDAAMDAARLGMRPALPRAFLEAAGPGYLTDTEWNLLDDDWLEQALTDTDKPSKGVLGPLASIRPRPGVQINSGNGPAWQLADYLDQHGRRARRELIPPESFWAAAADHGDPADLTTLAQAAENCGLYRDAARLFKRASAQGNPIAGARLIELLHTQQPSDQRPADWAAAHASLDDPSAVAYLLYALREVGATGPIATLLGRDPAAHVSLDDRRGVYVLLEELRKIGTEARGQIATLLGRDPATRASLDDPLGVPWLLDEGPPKVSFDDLVIKALADRVVARVSLDDPGEVAAVLLRLDPAGATGAVATLLGRDPAAHVSLDDPGGVAHLLGVLNATSGASGQVATLLGRDPAAHVSLDDPVGVANLLYELDEAGVATLLGRDPAARISLDDSFGVAELLRALRDARATGQVATLLGRNPAAHASLDSPGRVAILLGALRDAGATGQVATLLGRDPAAHASLDSPGRVAILLGALREAGATGQVATLATRAAAHASFDNPANFDGAHDLARLLGALRDAGATGQVATLLGRDPAAHVSLDNPGGVAKLLDALREAGAQAQAAKVIKRLPAAGLFPVFCEQEGHAQQFRFGRDADGRPAGRWAWTDLG